MKLIKITIKKISFLIILAFFTNLSWATSSESLILTYEQLKEAAKTPEFKVNVSAVADGIYATNAYLVIQGKQPLICPPYSAVLSASDFTNMLMLPQRPIYMLSQQFTSIVFTGF